MASDDARIPEHDRGRPVTLFLDGRPCRAFERETVGAALHASGVRVLMRSIKYHRPRGLFCVQGECASCLVRVDGKPNVRACMVRAEEGMRVESQNAFPSARRDLLGVVDKVYRKGLDVHDRFLRPRLLVPAYHFVIRRMAGFGRIPDSPRARTRPIRLLRPDVVVAGAGAAGLAAAAEAASAGRRVLVLEAGAEPGGFLLHLRRPVAGEDADGPTLARRLAESVRKAGGDLRLATPAVARYPDGVLTALAPQGLLEVHAPALVLANGSQDVPPLFLNNDLPGVLSARGALTLLHRDGVRPGRVAIVVGAGPDADLVRGELEAAGVRVEAVVPEIAAAEGGSGVEAVRLASGARLACDVVVAAAGQSPRPELVQQAGCALRWDEAVGAPVPVVDAEGRTSVPGVWACGEVAGAKDLRAALEEGRRAGRSAAEAGGAAR